MTERRRIDSPWGSFAYELHCVREKNFLIRVEENCDVHLFAPVDTTPEQADKFVQERGGWIVSTVKDQKVRQNWRPMKMVKLLSQAQGEKILSDAVDRMLPIAAKIGVQGPVELQFGTIRSVWGYCNFGTVPPRIKFSLYLAGCPQHLVDYVALHELVHICHPNHGPEFKAAMDKVMPDWRERDKELDDYDL